MGDTEKIILTLEANDEASKKIDAISKALRNLDKDANSTTSASGISKMASNLQDGINKINSVTRQYNSSMRGINRMMINSVKEMGSAIYDFTSDAINNYTKFSEQHAKVLGAMSADYDKTAESQAKFFADAQKLKDQAIQVGTYGFGGQGSLMSISDVSQAQESLIKAGVNPNDIIGTNVLKDVLTFAQGNQIDTDSAVTTAVTLGNQFNVPMENWGEMLDKISHTADMSVVEVSDIVQSLKWASGIAAGLDRPFEEILGMITVLGDFGLRGSQAGTGIQALLSRILTGDTTVITQAQAEVAPGKALEKFYEFEKVAKPDGNLLPMADVIDELNATMEDMTDEEQAWFAKKLFGLYQMKSAYALMNGEGADLNKIIEEIEKQSLGTNESKLDQLLNSQYGQLTSLENLWEGTKTDLGDRLSPFVNAVRDELFSFLQNDGNYNIDFDNLKSALDESCDLIEEKYGTAISTAVRNLGGITIDFTQVAQELGPEFANGLATMLGSIAEGDIFGEGGALDDWDKMIDNLRTSADGLPEDLQGVANAAISVIDMFEKLAMLNIASEIVELISSALQIATVLGGMVVHAAGMVVVNGNSTGTTPTKPTTPTTPTTPTGTTPAGTKLGPKGFTLKDGKSLFGTNKDIQKAFGTSADDVVSTMGKKALYTVDDVAKATGSTADEVIDLFGIAKPGWSKFGKAMGIAGTALEVGTTGYEAYNDFKKGDTKGGVEAIGEGAGSLSLGWGGAAIGGKAGAAIGTAIFPGPGTVVGAGIGSLAGGIAGSMAGDKIGGSLAGSAYDRWKYSGFIKDTSSEERAEATKKAKEREEKNVSDFEDVKAELKAIGAEMLVISQNNENKGLYDSKLGNGSSYTIWTGSPEQLAQYIGALNKTPTLDGKVPAEKGFSITNPYIMAELPKDTQILISGSLQKDEQISMQPQFNVEAPTVNVDVHVDKDNRVTKEITILNPGQGTMLDNWWSRTSSRYGVTSK